jgi:hypothetical protein
VDDVTWAETEDKAYAEDAEYDTWKREASEELWEFEERLRLNARKGMFGLQSRVPLAKHRKTAQEEQQEKDEANETTQTQAAQGEEEGDEGLVPAPPEPYTGPYVGPVENTNL